MTVGIIIQTRTGSSRLPSKVMMKADEDSIMLDYVINQLNYSKLHDELVIATTVLEQDDVIFDHVTNRNIQCFRGDEKNVLERLKFQSIVSSNFDEFFEIRVGSLYNYIDNNKKRFDYSGLRELPFRDHLLGECQVFFKKFYKNFNDKIIPEMIKNSIYLGDIESLDEEGKKKIKKYFKKTIFPMLTPMVFDNLHSFPILMNKVLIYGVVTKSSDNTNKRKISFIQIPVNIPRFFEYKIDEKIIFIPIEKIIHKYIKKFFRNVTIESISLFRIIRNGDFTLEESEDIETNFL